MLKIQLVLIRASFSFKGNLNFKKHCVLHLLKYFKNEEEKEEMKKI